MEKTIDFLIALVAVFISYWLGIWQQSNTNKEQNKSILFQKAENLLYFLDSNMIRGNMSNQAHDFLLNTCFELLNYRIDDKKASNLFNKEIKSPLSLLAYSLSCHSYNSGAIISISVSEVEKVKNVNLATELTNLSSGIRNMLGLIK